MFRSRRAACVGAVGLAIVMAPASRPARAQAPQPPPAAPREAAGRAITDAEALAFGRKLADAFNNLDAEALGQLFDLEAFLENALSGVEAPVGVRAGFRKGFLDEVARAGNPLLNEYRPVVQAGSRLEAIHAVRRDGAPTVMLRMIDPAGAASYVLYRLDRRPDGRVFAYDYYGVAAGEHGSDAIRRIALSAAAAADRGLLGRVAGPQKSLLAHLDDLQRMGRAAQQGQFAEVLAIYDALPDEVKREKIFQLQRYRAAQQLGDEDLYLKAIQDLARDHPNDLGADFLLIDGYLLQKDLPKSLECLGRVERALGGDAYLTFLRGNLYYMMGRKDEARATFRKAIAEEPDLPAPYDGLLTVGLEGRHFDDVADALDGIETKLNRPLNDLTRLPEFKDFLASPEGKAWQEKRAAREKPAADADAAPPAPSGG